MTSSCLQNINEISHRVFCFCNFYTDNYLAGCSPYLLFYWYGYNQKASLLLGLTCFSTTQGKIRRTKQNKTKQNKKASLIRAMNKEKKKDSRQGIL